MAITKLNSSGFILICISLIGCTSTPKDGTGGIAETYMNSSFSPVMPDEPLGPEHGLRFDWQLSKLHLQQLIQEGAQQCFPASVAQSKKRQNRIARELEGGLLLDAANDLVIHRRQLTELDNKLSYVLTQTKCIPSQRQNLDRVQPLETEQLLVTINQLFDLLNVDNQFANNSSEINPKYMGNLAKATAILTDYPKLSLSVTGHADANGTPEHNDKLALERAAQVKRYLSIFGLNPKRIKTQSLGDTLPLFEGNSDGVLLTNRRVSIEVLSEKMQ